MAAGTVVAPCVLAVQVCSIFLLQRVLGVLRLLMTYCEKVIHFACTEKSYEMLLKIIEVYIP